MTLVSMTYLCLFLKYNDEECVIQHASTIVDFLHYYDTYPEQSVPEIVNYLCTF